MVRNFLPIFRLLPYDDVNDDVPIENPRPSAVGFSHLLGVFFNNDELGWSLLYGVATRSLSDFLPFTPPPALSKLPIPPLVGVVVVVEVVVLWPGVDIIMNVVSPPLAGGGGEEKLTRFLFVDGGGNCNATASTAE